MRGNHNNGCRYVGSWKYDRPDGHGILYAEDGSVEYDGLWKEGKKDGV